MAGSIEGLLQQLLEGQKQIKKRINTVKTDLENDMELFKCETQGELKCHNGKFRDIESRLHTLETTNTKPSENKKRQRNNDRNRNCFGLWIKGENGCRTWRPRRVSSMRRVRNIYLFEKAD